MSGRTLLSTVRKERLTPFHIDRLQVIDDLDLSNVRRKVAEDRRAQGLSVDEKYLDEGLLALRQYYAIAVLDSLNMHAVSDAVDPFWHAHILHTEEYIAFCNKLVGGYMHHDPLDHQKRSAVAAVDRLYRYTTKCFDRFFSYVNQAFFPTELPTGRLVCLHMNSTYAPDVWEHGLLALDPAMQAGAYAD
jgi:hypothetical protein